MNTRRLQPEHLARLKLLLEALEPKQDNPGGQAVRDWLQGEVTRLEQEQQSNGDPE